MKIFKFHNESGRSMVEMLGTLAIMGLLSVGGISGYTTAMNNHKANEAINDAKRLAMMISSERMLGKTGTLDSKEYEKGLYTFSQGNDQGKIVLTVQDIPSGVANKLNKMKDDLQIADIIIADNNVTFEFMNDLSGKPSEIASSQGSGSGGQDQGGQQGGDNEGQGDQQDEWDDPACTDVTCNEGEGCVSGRCVDANQDACVTDCNGDCIYDESVDDVVCPTESVGCTKNSDCNTWCAAQERNNENVETCYCASLGNTWVGSGGRCSTISKSEKAQGYSNSDVMPFQAAINFCKALGCPMIGSDSSGCALLGDIVQCPGLGFSYWLRDCNYVEDSVSSDGACYVHENGHAEIEGTASIYDFGYHATCDCNR